MVGIHSAPAWLGLIFITAALILNMVSVGTPNWANNDPRTQPEQNLVLSVDGYIEGGGEVTQGIPLPLNYYTQAPTEDKNDTYMYVTSPYDFETATYGGETNSTVGTGSPDTSSFNDEFNSSTIAPGVTVVTPVSSGFGNNTTVLVTLGVFGLCEDGDCRPLIGEELEPWYMALQILVSVALLLDASSVVIGGVLAVCPSCCDPSCCESLHVWSQYNLAAIIAAFLCCVTSQVLFAAEALQYDFLGKRLHLAWCYNAYFGVVFLHIVAVILYFCEVKRIYTERAPYYEIGSYKDYERQAIRTKDNRGFDYQNMSALFDSDDGHYGDT